MEEYFDLWVKITSWPTSWILDRHPPWCVSLVDIHRIGPWFSPDISRSRQICNNQFILIHHEMRRSAFQSIAIYCRSPVTSKSGEWQISVLISTFRARGTIAVLEWRHPHSCALRTNGTDVAPYTSQWAPQDRISRLDSHNNMSREAWHCLYSITVMELNIYQCASPRIPRIRGVTDLLFRMQTKEACLRFSLIP